MYVRLVEVAPACVRRQQWSRIVMQTTGWCDFNEIDTVYASGSFEYTSFQSPCVHLVSFITNQEALMDEA